MSATKSNVPVVLVTSHRVTPGRLADFSVAARGMLSAALRSPGCLGGGLVGSESDDKRWQIECRFVDAESMAVWENSGSYSRWARYMQRFAARLDVRRDLGNTSLGQATEAAMAPVGDRSRRSARLSSAPSPSAPSPKRTKRRGVAVMMSVVVFGAVLAVNRMALPFLSDISPLIRILVLCVVVTGIAIWVIPPALSRMSGSAEREPQIGAPRTRRSAQAKLKAAKAEEKARDRRRPEVKESDTRETLEPVGKPADRTRRRRAEPAAAAEPELIYDPTTERVSVPVGPAAGAPTARAPRPNLPSPSLPRAPQGRPVVPLETPRGGFFPTSPHRVPNRER